jgi:hypothetical protein
MQLSSFLENDSYNLSNNEYCHPGGRDKLYPTSFVAYNSFAIVALLTLAYARSKKQ